MFIYNSSPIVEITKAGSYNFSEKNSEVESNLEDEIAKTKISLTVAPVCVVVLVVAVLISVNIWKVCQYRRHKRNVLNEINRHGINGNHGLSTSSVDEDIVLDEVINSGRIIARQPCLNEPHINIRVVQPDTSTDEEDEPQYYVPPLTHSRSFSRRNLNSPRTDSTREIRKANARKSVGRSRADDRLSELKKQKSSVSSTPYPSSVSTRITKARESRGGHFVSRNVLSARCLADKTACLGSQCDCRLCKQNSLESSMFPNLGSWVYAGTRSGGDSFCSHCGRCFADGRPSYAKINPKLNPHLDEYDGDGDDDDDIGSEELYSTGRVPSTDVDQKPSIVKSAPAVFALDSSSSSSSSPNVDSIDMTIVNAADFRAFSNANCFPSAWDYEPGGAKDHEIYKNKLRNLKRIQHYNNNNNNRPTLCLNYCNNPNVNSYNVGRELKRRMEVDGKRSHEFVYVRYQGRMLAAIKKRIDSNLRFVPVDWRGSREESFSSDSQCSTCESEESRDEDSFYCGPINSNSNNKIQIQHGHVHSTSDFLDRNVYYSKIDRVSSHFHDDRHHRSNKHVTMDCRHDLSKKNVRWNHQGTGMLSER